MDTVYVYTIKDLKEALNQKRERIIAGGKLGERLTLLTKIKGTPKIHKGMKVGQLAKKFSDTTAVPAKIWLTLILTVGITIIVSLILGYNAKVKFGNSEVVFERR